MRTIPGNTKVQIELFKGISLTDMALGAISAALFVLIAVSTLPFRWVFALIHLFLWVILLFRVDGEPNYVFVMNMIRHSVMPRRYKRLHSDEDLKKIFEEGYEQFSIDDIFEADRSGKSDEADVADISAFTGISDGYIEYGDKYYGAVIEIPPVAFRFFSQYRRSASIESGVGSILRSVKPDYAMNIVKIERPVRFDSYIDLEYSKLEKLKEEYKKGSINEAELRSRVEIIYDRIYELQDLSQKSKVVTAFYYIVLFDSDKQQLDMAVSNAMSSLRQGELDPRRLGDKDIALFLKYSNTLDFDENDIERIRPEDYAAWASPESITVRSRDVVVSNVITHNMRTTAYPVLVGDAWIAGLMSYPSTKVVIKAKPMDRAKSVKAIDRSLSELRAKYMTTGTDSEILELRNHIETLQQLLATLQSENESLLNVNIYVTAYDILQSEEDPAIPERESPSFLARFSNMKKNVRRIWMESGFRLGNMNYNQTKAFIGSQISAYDPMEKEGRGMPSNTIAASFPWIYSFIMDPLGVKLGESSGVPVFLDLFRRDSERVNSNMVIVGKSGSGKSYATKSLLSNLAADDAKIFILDPENEYTELAKNLNGKFINVANAQFGRLNPFHIITALDDDEEGSSGSSYSTHLQFLEEFFTQILPDCDKDALEYLNSLVDRMYHNKGITEETDLSALRPEDYPVFDDLYDEILREFQRTDNEYIRTMLRTLMNYISKFAQGGRNAVIWNGPSSITTEENFTVFNFQSLLANRNTTVANAQMLLVLKYIDNEIIKNRDYNTRYGLSRKIVVVIDEAHVFIDPKYPVALDFMFQLAKRIRKYNGMQIVITQNIKDFVGSEEIAHKSTAIINACQYSFIFSLAPNDMNDLCTLYEKAGGINEQEQEEIIQAPRGQAFTILSPTNRSSFRITVPDNVRSMFEDADHRNSYFEGRGGQENWDSFIGSAPEERAAFLEARNASKAEHRAAETAPSHGISFVELSEEEYEASEKAAELKTEPVRFTEVSEPEPISFTEVSEAEPISFTEVSEPEPFSFEEVSEPVSPVQERRPSYAAPAPEDMRPERVPQVIVQAPASSARTEELLAELVEKLSKDSLMSEIRRTVDELVEAKLRETGAATAAAGAAAAAAGAFMKIDPISVPADQAIPGSPEAADLIGEDIFGLDDEDGPDIDDDDDEDDDFHFDIMSLLAMEAAKIDSISPIDEMLNFGDEKCEVTLEQLAAYLMNGSDKESGAEDQESGDGDPGGLFADDTDDENDDNDDDMSEEGLWI